MARPGEKIRLSKIEPGDTADATKEKALARVEKLREKLLRWQEVFYAEHRHSLLIIFQAMDTGGKDGSVKSLFSCINPAGLHITSFKAPTAEELDHDFLWRVHRATPGKGMIGIWNRSHYEDVLVARVHKLVEKKVWKARYEQINRFEKNLHENGTTILKFMLHISKNEQCRRLQARLDDPEKRWKFNPGTLKSARCGTTIRKPTRTRSIAAPPITRPGTLSRRITNGRAISPSSKRLSAHLRK